MSLITRVRSMVGLSRAGLARLAGADFTGDIALKQTKKLFLDDDKDSYLWANGADDQFALRVGSGAVMWGDATTLNLNKIVQLNGQPLKSAEYLELDEITTPGATASHGKVYTKADNKLYFQDGAGVEHEVVSGWPSWTGYKSTDAGYVNDNIVGAVPGFVLPVLANEIWHWEVDLLWRTLGGGPGIRIAMAGPANTWVVWSAVIYLADGSGLLAWDGGLNTATAFGTEFTQNIGGVALNRVRISGSALVTANGSISLQAAQKTSHATEARVEKGSSMIAHRML